MIREIPQRTCNVIDPFLFRLRRGSVNGGHADLVTLQRQGVDQRHVRVGLLHEERAHCRTAVGVVDVCGTASLSSSLLPSLSLSMPPYLHQHCHHCYYYIFITLSSSQKGARAEKTPLGVRFDHRRHHQQCNQHPPHHHH